MNDIGASGFYSAFWDYYVAIITIVSVLGCAVFLWSQSRRTVKAKVNAKGEIETTGHVWDGDLQEYHNPMPRWWIWLFYLTVLFSVIYLILYPGLGTQWQGVLKWTQSGQYQAEVKAAEARFGPIFAAYAAQPIEQVAADARARQMGERLFLNNCAQCHGSDARGSRGFPNLADGDWLYGGAPAMLVTTVTEGRNGVMPPMGAAVGGKADVEDVANYVLSLSDSAHDSVKAVRGKAKFDSRVCRVPRRRRQGQPGARRAQPDRQDLALRRQRGHDLRNDSCRPQQCDAELQEHPHRSRDPPGRSVCLVAHEQQQGARTGRTCAGEVVA